MADSTLKDVIDRLKAEGQLTRNTGTNSIKSININISKLSESFSMGFSDFLDFQKSFLEKQSDLTNRMMRDAALRDKPTKSDGGGRGKKGKGLTDITSKNTNWGLILGAIVISFFDELKSAIRIPSAVMIVVKSITGVFTWLGNKFTTIKNFIMKPINYVSDIFSKIGNFFGKTFGPTSGLGRAIVAIRKFIAPVLAVFTNLGATFGNIGGSLGIAVKSLRFLMGPVGRVIFSIIDFFNGFMAGFAEGGLLGGIKGGILEVIRGLITKPLDLLKDIVSWAAKKLGFGEFSAQLDSFSFTDMFNDFIVVLENLFEDVGKWFGTLFSNPLAAIESAAKAYIGIYLDIGTWLYNKAIKPFTDWLGTLFSNPLAAIESAAGTYLGLFKDAGTWLYNKAIKPFTDWIGRQFGVDITGTIETAVGAYFGFFKDAGTWIYDRTIGHVVNWLKETFASDSEKSTLTVISELWDKGIGYLTDNFKAVTDWVASIPSKIIFAAEEMWINAAADLKIGFNKFIGFLTSIPDQMLLMAQKLVMEKLGTFGTFAARQLNITPESIKASEAKMAKNKDGDAEYANTVNAQRDLKLSNLNARRNEADLARIKESAPSSDKSAGNTVVGKVGGDTYVTNNYNTTTTGGNNYTLASGVNGQGGMIDYY
jgi:hypothetical protein